jgi:SEC-C motif domain protein
MRCPCRKKSETTAYADCCQPCHLGVRPAVTATALMRSRYAAFALRDAAYIQATWHASTRPTQFEFTAGQEWQSLQVRAAATDGDNATVEFVARSRIGGTTHALAEVSRFVREGGRWFYVDGVIG